MAHTGAGTEQRISMGELWGDLKRFWAERQPIILALFGSFLRLRAGMFVMQAESHSRLKMQTTLGLISLYVVLCLLETFLNPGRFERFDLVETLRPAALAVLILLLTCLPLCVLLGLFEKRRAIFFLIDVQIVATTLTAVVISIMAYLGLLLSPALLNDFSKLREGKGQDAAIFQAFCPQLQANKQLEGLETELDHLTGEISNPPSYHNPLFDSRTEEQLQHDNMRDFQALVRLTAKLPDAQQQRAWALRTEIYNNVTKWIHYDGLTPIWKNYSNFLVAYLISQLAIPIFSLMMYVIIWRALIRPTTGRRRVLSVLRFGLAVLVSIGFTYWTTATNMGFPSLPTGLQGLHDQNVANTNTYWWCEKSGSEKGTSPIAPSSVPS
jgi:hypothetical protein